VSSQDFSAPYTPAAVNGSGAARISLESRLTRERYWLHLLLFLLTLGTTTMVGALLARSFSDNRPVAEDLSYLGRVLAEPALLLHGLPFSLTLLTILMAHEMGHYLACVHYDVDASLPYFLPGPTFIGTFGAFIRIRSPIYSKRILFDIGVAGPIAGFVFLLPALSIGLAFSKVIPGIARQGDLLFGTPLLLRLVEKLIYPGVPAADIYLHPVARAAWVGIFATALNLLPIGQLDGGHILYAFSGRHFRLLSRIFLLALVPLGFLYWPWWGWALLLLLFGLKHPVIYDQAELSRGRKQLGWIALAILLLSFMPVPVETGV
jgi:membrane-associated protease RseP (regulator of RpoE activity)